MSLHLAQNYYLLFYTIGKQTTQEWAKMNMYYIERGLPPVHMIAPISIL